MHLPRVNTAGDTDLNFKYKFQNLLWNELRTWKNRLP